MIANTTRIEAMVAKMKEAGETSVTGEGPDQDHMVKKIKIGEIPKITKISGKTIGEMTAEIGREATTEKKTANKPSKNSGEMIMRATH